MGSRRNVIDENGEVADLTRIDPSEMRGFSDLPASLQNKLRGRPKAAITKERITIRLSPDVLASFRATGDGWQTRIDAALRDWLDSKKTG